MALVSNGIPANVFMKGRRFLQDMEAIRISRFMLSLALNVVVLHFGRLAYGVELSVVLDMTERTVCVWKFVVCVVVKQASR